MLNAFRVSALAFTLVVLVACGGEGPIVTPPPPPPAQLAVTCPANQYPAGYGPMAVNFPTATTTGGTSPVSVVATPASGSVFPAGQSAVNVEARSADGQVKNCSFSVTVSAPPPPPTATLSVGPPRILFGDSVTAATTCVNGSLAVRSWWTTGNPSTILNGTDTVKPGTLGIIEFTYICTGGGGTAVAKDTVVVEAVPPVGARTLLNRPDQGPGRKVQAVYMSIDGIDRGLDTNGTIENSILSAENWLGGKIGLVHRWDEWGGRKDITFVRSTISDAEMTVQGYAASVEGELHKAGLDDSTKRYVVYLEGRGHNSWCGEGGGNVAKLFLQSVCAPTVFAISPTAPIAVWELTLIHELFHVSGAVDPRAPDYSPDCGGGHLSVLNDIMRCGAGSYNPDIDKLGRNYFGDNVPAGIPNLKYDQYFKPWP